MAAWLVQTFQPERFVYLALSVVAFLFVLTIGVFVLIKGDWKSALSLVGPSGVFGFALAQLFQVWNKTVAVMLGTPPEAGQ